MTTSKVNDKVFNRVVNYHPNRSKMTTIKNKLVNAIFRTTDNQLLGYQDILSDTNYLIKGV